MNETTQSTTSPANDNPPQTDLASRVAAGIIESVEGDSGSAAVAGNEVEVSGRFADLELDTIPAVDPSPAEVGDAPLPLEIDGVEVESNVEAPVCSSPALAALDAAGYNFPVSLQPMQIMDPRFLPPNMGDFRACLRDDTGHIFGIVSPDYGFTQPSELAALVDAALPEGAAVTCKGSTWGDFMSFECSLPEGTFDISPEQQAEANRKRWIHIDPRDPQGNIPVRAKLLFKHTYGGKGTMDLSLLVEALVCGNGLCIPLRDGKRQISIRHTCNFEQRVNILRHAFEVAGDFTSALAGMMADMVGTRISAAEFDQYAKHMFPGQSTQEKNKRKRFEEIYNTAVGCAPGTAWGALQAGTYYATHETPVRVGGRSLSNYTLDDPDHVPEAQLETYRGQARWELLVNGKSGEFTERAYQYVSNHMLGAS